MIRSILTGREGNRSFSVTQNTLRVGELPYVYLKFVLKNLEYEFSILYSTKLWMDYVHIRYLIKF